MQKWQRYLEYCHWQRNPDPDRLLTQAMTDIDFQYEHGAIAQALWVLWKKLNIGDEQKGTPVRDWAKYLRAEALKTPLPTLSEEKKDKLRPSEVPLAVRVLRWHFYLAQFRPLQSIQPQPDIHERALRLKHNLMQYTCQPQLDPFYNLGREYVKNAYMTLGGEAWYLQHHPREKGFTNFTDYLNMDLTPAETEELNLEIRKSPTEHWTTMKPRTQTMWLLAAYVYAFDTITEAMTFPMHWQDHYWIPWWEWATPQADTKLKITQRMELQPRPLVVMWASNDWTIHVPGMQDPAPVSTTEMTEALVQWQYWTQVIFHNKLENGSPAPLVFMQ